MLWVLAGASVILAGFLTRVDATPRLAMAQQQAAVVQMEIPSLLRAVAHDWRGYGEPQKITLGTRVYDVQVMPIERPYLFSLSLPQMVDQFSKIGFLKPDQLARQVMRAHKDGVLAGWDDFLQLDGVTPVLMEQLRAHFMVDGSGLMQVQIISDHGRARGEFSSVTGQMRRWAWY